MEKKRSKGVTIFAWVMIIVNLYALLSSFKFQKNFFDVYKSFPAGLNISLIVYSILSAAIGVVAGFGILKLKDIMRKIGVAINALDLLTGVPLFFLSLNDIRTYTYTVAFFELKRNPVNLNIDIIAKAGFYTAVFMSLAIFTLNALFIYFFTRPKVKEQFK